jgi:geranylgeranyl diphosphate synthase, type II
MTRVKTALSKDILSPELARELIDGTLDVFFLQHTAKAKLISPEYATLWHSMRTLINAGGKRIRPYVTLMTYQAFSNKPIADIVPIAAAQELLHVALLIHDDIIDRDYIRYGIDNISGQYDNIYRPLIADVTERRHFSDSAAILAGDLLLSSGYQLIQTSALDSNDLAIASQIFANAIFTVAGGELLDTESAFRPFNTIDSIAIARYKTAHYSFVTPITMGARLAGVDAATVASLEAFGEHIGIAYQLVDDLIGIFGSQSITGKSNVTDITESKHTYLIEQFMACAGSDQLATFHQLFGKKDISESESSTFRDIMTASGAKARVESTIAVYTDQALSILHDMHIDDSARHAFEQLAERAVQRDR